MNRFRDSKDSVSATLATATTVATRCENKSPKHRRKSMEQTGTRTRRARLPVVRPRYASFPLLWNEEVLHTSRASSRVAVTLTNYRFFYENGPYMVNIPCGSIDSVAGAKEAMFLLIHRKDGRIHQIDLETSELMLMWTARLMSILSTNGANGSGGGSGSNGGVCNGGSTGGSNGTVAETVTGAGASQKSSGCESDARVVPNHELFAFVHYRDSGARLYGNASAEFAYDFDREVARLEFDLRTKWRVSAANRNYEQCRSYPERILVPASVSEQQLLKVFEFRSASRVPAVVWRCRWNGCVVARSSQPAVGLLYWREFEDEALLKALTDACVVAPVQRASHDLTDPDFDEEFETSRKKLLVMDARSYTSAVANRTRGGGCECREYYATCDMIYMNLVNIHQVRKSFQSVRSACESYVTSEVQWWSQIEASFWLTYVSNLLKSANKLTEAIVVEQRSVLVHCSDGWDRTAQLVSLAQLLLDPFYRTMHGFQILVEKEWISFGHKFADRCQQGFTNADSSEKSAIFIQWLDCVHQLIEQFPIDFEFNDIYLVKLAQHTYSNLFGTFLCNNEKDFKQNCLHKTYSVFQYLNSNKNLQNKLYKKPLDVDQRRESVLVASHYLSDLHFWSGLFLGTEPEMSHKYSIGVFGATAAAATAVEGGGSGSMHRTNGSNGRSGAKKSTVTTTTTAMAASAVATTDPVKVSSAIVRTRSWSDLMMDDDDNDDDGGNSNNYDDIDVGLLGRRSSDPNRLNSNANDSGNDPSLLDLTDGSLSRSATVVTNVAESTSPLFVVGSTTSNGFEILPLTTTNTLTGCGSDISADLCDITSGHPASERSPHSRLSSVSHRTRFASSESSSVSSPSRPTITQPHRHHNDRVSISARHPKPNQPTIVTNTFDFFKTDTGNDYSRLAGKFDEFKIESSQNDCETCSKSQHILKNVQNQKINSFANFESSVDVVDGIGTDPDDDDDADDNDDNDNDDDNDDNVANHTDDVIVRQKHRFGRDGLFIPQCPIQLRIDTLLENQKTTIAYLTKKVQKLQNALELQLNHKCRRQTINTAVVCDNNRIDKPNSLSNNSILEAECAIELDHESVYGRLATEQQQQQRRQQLLPATHLSETNDLCSFCNSVLLNDQKKLRCKICSRLFCAGCNLVSTNTFNLTLRTDTEPVTNPFLKLFKGSTSSSHTKFEPITICQECTLHLKTNETSPLFSKSGFLKAQSPSPATTDATLPITEATPTSRFDQPIESFLTRTLQDGANNQNYTCPINNQKHTSS